MEKKIGYLVSTIEKLNKSRNDIADVIQGLVDDVITDLMKGVDSVKLKMVAGVVYDDDTICYVHTIYVDKDRNNTICVKGSYGALSKDVDVDCGFEEIDLDGKVAILNALNYTLK